MQCEKPLSYLYRLYFEGILSKNDLEGRIFKYLLDNSERYHIFGGDQERWEEFLSWLYPRLARSVDLYRDIGSSFDAYITSLIHHAAKEYRCREADHNITEYVCWKAKAEEMMLHENEPDYSDGPKNVSIPEDISSRQILLLLLKSYFFVSDDFVKRVAETIGIEVEAIRHMIGEIKKLRSEREADIVLLRQRLHSQYYRCLAYQKRMNAANPGTDYYKKMEDRFKRAKKRYNAMKKRLGGVRLSASNRMIADVMGISHGTVDSSLFALKNYLSKLAF